MIAEHTSSQNAHIYHTILCVICLNQRDKELISNTREKSVLLRVFSVRFIPFHFSSSTPVGWDVSPFSSKLQLDSVIHTDKM